jgi:pyruvate dehydrogenase E2 component (dihydrolipoamide acetyltransferase)
VAAIEFRLPDVGEGIATAEIVDWRVAAGDHVKEGQDLVEIQTDKAIVVIPCPTTGVVTRLGGEAGETLDIGAVLAVFEADGLSEVPGRSEAPGGSEAPGAGEARDGSEAPGAGEAPVPDGRRPLAAPATRRLARELGIDLANVRGSGPHGRIMREDLHPAPSASAPRVSPDDPVRRGPDPRSAPAPRPGQVVPLRGVRRAIARTLTRAWQEIPHVIDYREVDATNLVRFRGVLKQRALERGDEALARALSPTPLIVRAAAKALADHPYVNSSIDLERGEITLHEQINIGIATATADGLTVPVLHGADGKSIPEIAVEVAELVAVARGRRLRPEQLAGGTFTVNNYGGLGVWLGTPIIRPPEVANLGVGAVRDQVVPVDGVPAVRPILVLAVSADHRVLDGDTLAAFVTQIVGSLEEPMLLLEDLR